MSALAEGADQLVAEEALALDIPLIVPMPMPGAHYIDDFGSIREQESFDYLCSRAAEFYELPITPGNTRESIREHGPDRTQQYAQLGVFCAHTATFC